MSAAIALLRRCKTVSYFCGCLLARRLGAWLATSAVFLSGYLPPVLGMSDGPHHAAVSPKHAEQVRMLLLAALICTVSLQLCAAAGFEFARAPTAHAVPA